MATAVGKYFLETVELYGIDEIHYYPVDQSYSAYGEKWDREFRGVHEDDFYDEDTRLGELMQSVVPEVFFEEYPAWKRMLCLRRMLMVSGLCMLMLTLRIILSRILVRIILCLRRSRISGVLLYNG